MPKRSGLRCDARSANSNGEQTLILLRYVSNISRASEVLERGSRLLLSPAPHPGLEL